MSKVFASEISDETLVLQVQQGEEQFISELVVRFAAAVAYHARRCAIMGLELEDLMQEGMIALLDAARTYTAGEQASFKTYSGKCIANRLTTVVTAYHRGKNMPLNSYMPIDELTGIAEKSSKNPEELFILKEQEILRRQKMQTLLSRFEMQCTQLYLAGHSYEEISEELECSTKSVDNALQRVRHKLGNSPK